ncbi:MAG: hypothetical protein JO271_11605 [Verrucomicrobia bacterium]|nr:hypothetical protein [Verrucomicrobiota bacterium]
MGEFYAELAQALRERIEVIQDRNLRENPAAHLAKIREASEKIDHLKSNLPTDAHPMLAHYLDRMSFSKALEFIETEGLTQR